MRGVRIPPKLSPKSFIAFDGKHLSFSEHVALIPRRAFRGDRVSLLSKKIISFV
ncbi:hypothetical protein PORCAN_1736 [Porphyromonas crevioricanis JCM 13913]|nr:hypothetical protein PORCAN_1736 [Porphyromonas crevioricanis JCM 13913]